MKIDPGKIPSVETYINVSKALRIDNRIIHFLTKVTTITTKDGSILGGWADPLAMVVSEQNEEYVFSFTGESFTIDQFVEMAPSLRDILNSEKRIHKEK